MVLKNGEPKVVLLWHHCEEPLVFWRAYAELKHKHILNRKSLSRILQIFCKMKPKRFFRNTRRLMNTQCQRECLKSEESCCESQIKWKDPTGIRDEHLCLCPHIHCPPAWTSESHRVASERRRSISSFNSFQHHPRSSQSSQRYNREKPLHVPPSYVCVSRTALMGFGV